MSSPKECAICDDPDAQENPVVTCIECGIKVHKLCYGINEKASSWKCSTCKLGATKYVFCQLCLKKGGPLKQTNCKKWIHVICALFTPGITFSNKVTMEPIDISQISKSMKNKLCSFCFNARGYSSLCAMKSCKNRLHITCGKEKNTLKEVIDPFNDTIKFRAYCNDHKPKENSRRVSSESIKLLLNKKQKVKLKKQSILGDSSWILNQVNSFSTPTNSKKNRYRDTECNANENGTPAKKSNPTDESLLIPDSDIGSPTPSIVPSMNSTMKEVSENSKDDVIKQLMIQNELLKNELEVLKRNLETRNEMIHTDTQKGKTVDFMPVDLTLNNVENTLKNLMEPELKGNEYIYPNGVRVEKSKMRLLNEITDDIKNDRKFVNYAFAAMFSDKYLKNKIISGLDREKLLQKLRETKRHETIKTLFEYRVVSSGKGEVKYRASQFKLAFRVKFNNWWNTNYFKIQTKVLEKKADQTSAHE